MERRIGVSSELGCASEFWIDLRWHLEQVCEIF
jgi:hypothetical protein